MDPIAVGGTPKRCKKDPKGTRDRCPTAQEYPPADSKIQDAPRQGEEPQDFDTRTRRTSSPAHQNPRRNKRRQPRIKRDLERNLQTKRKYRRNTQFLFAISDQHDDFDYMTENSRDHI
jgi:hypothetical protein